MNARAVDPASHGRTRRALGLLLGRLFGVAGALAAGQLIVGLIYLVGARAITPATLGLIATCVAVATIGSTVFDAGLTALLIREVAAGALERQRAAAIVGAKRRWTPVLALATFPACLAIAPTVATGLLLGCLGVVMWEAQTGNGLLRARERFTLAATAQVSGRAVGLAVVALMVAVEHPDLALPLALVAAFLLEAVLARVFLGARSARPTSQREAAPYYRAAISYGLASLAASAQQLDTPLVALGAGAAGAGLYAAAGRLLGPLGFLATSLGLVAAPWLARARRDELSLRHEERRVFRIAWLLAAAPLGAALVGPPLLPVLLGPEYAASGVVLSVLALGSVVSTLNQPMSIILQNRGRQGITAIAISIGLGIGLVATLVLATVGGAVGAAIGFGLSQVYILIHLALAVRSVRLGKATSPPRREVDHPDEA
ncbi:oligosaccharide flippase family protein [Actinomycetospora lutea]|uniref:lipopolysaccharide biosynthesis protein n=1 Tax=Actinomycetospora lutea TaxID=663604 RepID=UPI0023658DDB|nr:oligosaccharide flippase family protein [Actinomycetospora lutea]MDD7942856.1 oligosaccharide flippase family protein [Actinomycetospora lutea]